MNCRESASSFREAPPATQEEREKLKSLPALSSNEEIGLTDVDMELEAMSQPEVTPTNEIVGLSIVQPDSGWSWVVCLSCVVCNGVLFGITNSFGILYVHIREKYEEAGLDNISFQASWVGSVCTGLTFLLSAVTGVISDAIGIRKTGLIGGVVALAGILSSAFVEKLTLLYLTFGVLLGVGFSLVFCPSFVILGHYFKRHLGLASGLVDTGGSIFTVILSLGLPALLDVLGLQKTFLALSGLVALLIPCTLTWKATFARKISQAAASEPSSSCKASENKTTCYSPCCRLPKFLNADIWRNKSFMLWTLSLGISLIGYLIPFVHMVKYVEDEFPGHRGNLIILILAVSGGVCRPLAGKLADLNWVRRLFIQLVAYAIFGACEICIPFSQTYWGLVAVVIILGGCSGVCTCLVPPIVFDLVGEVNASQALGFVFAIASISLTAGPPLAGLLYDHLGSYKVVFHVAGCFPLIGAFLMLFITQPPSTSYSS